VNSSGGISDEIGGKVRHQMITCFGQFFPVLSCQSTPVMWSSLLVHLLCEAVCLQTFCCATANLGFRYA